MPQRVFSRYSDSKSNRTILSKVSTHQKEIIEYFTSILLLNFNLTEVFSQVPKSSIEPPPSLMGRGGVSGLNRAGGIFEMGVLFCLAKTMVSVVPKELEYKVDKPQVREVGGHAAKDQ